MANPKIIGVILVATLLSSFSLFQNGGDNGRASLLPPGLVAKEGQGNQGGGSGGQGNQGGGTGGQGNQGGGTGGQGNQGGGTGGQGNQGGGTGGNSGGTNGGDGGQGNQAGGAASGTASGGGGGGGQPGMHGRGLQEHAATLRFITNLHKVAPSASDAPVSLSEIEHRKHEMVCSMYRYLQRLRISRPRIKPGYIDWLVDEVAKVIGRDVLDTKAALLGYPHEHLHLDPLLRRIANRGCGSSEDLPAIQNEEFAEQHGIRDFKKSDDEYGVQSSTSEHEIIFGVTRGDHIFTEYVLTHQKLLHLFIVREDLSHYFHFHPTLDADGIWRIPFTPDVGGNYWMFADFMDDEGQHHILHFQHFYASDPGLFGFERDTRTEKTIDKYTVRFTALPYSEGVLFTLYMQDAHGHSPFFEPYLGALGHTTLISADGDFIHTHPTPAGDHLSFHAAEATDDFYRIFTQFKMDDQIFTLAFDWERKEGEE